MAMDPVCCTQNPEESTSCHTCGGSLLRVCPNCGLHLARHGLVNCETCGVDLIVAAAGDVKAALAAPTADIVLPDYSEFGLVATRKQRRGIIGRFRR